jgi:phospholipase/carboxylesterase
VLHIIDRLKTEYNIGSVYLVGFSQGAEMAYLTGLSHPEIIDGIVVFGGRLMPEWLADGAITQAAHTAPAHGHHDGLRVFIAHGDEDVPERAYSARDTLMAAGFDVEYHEFHGGHFIHLDTLHEAEHWMKQDLATTTAKELGGALAGTTAAADKPGGATVTAASGGTAKDGTKKDKPAMPSPPTS